MKQQFTITMSEDDQKAIKNTAVENRESFSQYLTKSALIRAGLIKE